MRLPPLSTGFYPRAALFGLLLIALADPSVPWPGRVQKVFVLLDDSDSMGQGLDALWPSLARRLAELPPDAELGVVRFAAVPRIELPPTPIAASESVALLSAPGYPRRLPLDRGATDLAAALDAALRQAVPGEGVAVLLTSDLRQTRGNAEAALEAAQRAGVPVYALIPPAPAGDGGIADVQHPEAAHAGTTVPIAVRLSGPASASGLLSWRVNGEPQGHVAVSFSGDGESAAELRAGPCPTGGCRVDLSLELPGDPAPANNTRTVLVTVPEPRPVLYVAASERPLAAALRRGGRALRRISPEGLPRQPEALEGYAAVVLDDLPLDSLAPPARSALGEAVRRQGLGLLVLGGPHSFGRGGYRHSDLEELLPVIAEGGDARSAASILFLLDKSGSMDRQGDAAGGFAMARRAVLETLKGLWRQDRVGIAVFDAGVREVLPLGVHADPERALDRALALSPSGGTRLAPALEAAIDQLSRADTRQRLLVLVSDGRFVDSDFAGMEKKLAEGGIEFIALAVGDEAALPALERLAGAGRGRVLRVGRTAELPRLMRGEVERDRAAVESGPALPQAVRPLPFAAGGTDLPAWSAYAVTAPREDATVYLQSARGDPLLAEWQSGAGRVLAVPGGLADWAAAWLGRPDFVRLVAGLVDRVSAATADPGLNVRARSGPGRLEFEIEALAARQAGWADAPEAEVLLAGPSGTAAAVRVPASAPGLYRGSVPAGVPGLYRLAASAGNRRTVTAVMYGMDEEADFSRDGETAGRRWIGKGLVRLLPEGGINSLVPNSTKLGFRPLILGIVGAAYLLLVVRERLNFFSILGRSRTET